jgi:hypothetical protein
MLSFAGGNDDRTAPRDDQRHKYAEVEYGEHPEEGVYIAKGVRPRGRVWRVRQGGRIRQGGSQRASRQRRRRRTPCQEWRLGWVQR